MKSLFTNSNVVAALYFAFIGTVAYYVCSVF